MMMKKKNVILNTAHGDLNHYRSPYIFFTNFQHILHAVVDQYITFFLLRWKTFILFFSYRFHELQTIVNCIILLLLYTTKYNTYI